VNKKDLTERDICTKFLTPAVKDAGWDVLSQIREQVHFTKGRIIVRGRLVTRGKAKFADYILYYKPNIPIALIEAKDNVRKRDVFTRYGAQARAVLEALLQKYQDEGVTGLDDPRILKIAPFDAMGTPVELLKTFGGRDGFEKAVHELQAALYRSAA
jgi:type I site-specific restriction endonuclease